MDILLIFGLVALVHLIVLHVSTRDRHSIGRS
jgi:hypothetical protein